MTTGLTDFQMEVARLFFELPASEGFLLAGGGALLATGLTSRPTDDLDFFGRRGDNDVPNVAAQLVAALAERGWLSATAVVEVRCHRHVASGFRRDRPTTDRHAFHSSEVADRPHSSLYGQLCLTEMALGQLQLTLRLFWSGQR